MSYRGGQILLGGLIMKAYCMKCRAKKEMKNVKAVTMKNGRAASQGICTTCGTKMFQIGKGYLPID
jgi:hypothetical protein